MTTHAAALADDAGIDRLLSVEEVCALLNTSRTQLRRLTNGGQVRSVKAGSRRLFRASDVAAYIAGLDAH